MEFRHTGKKGFPSRRPPPILPPSWPTILKPTCVNSSPGRKRCWWWAPACPSPPPATPRRPRGPGQLAFGPGPDGALAVGTLRQHLLPDLFQDGDQAGEFIATHP
jgi:hypothetical protein